MFNKTSTISLLLSSPHELLDFLDFVKSLMLKQRESNQKAYPGNFDIIIQPYIGVDTEHEPNRDSSSSPSFVSLLFFYLLPKKLWTGSMRAPLFERK
jgi:hypothetical protein